MVVVDEYKNTLSVSVSYIYVSTIFNDNNMGVVGLSSDGTICLLRMSHSPKYNYFRDG